MDQYDFPGLGVGPHDQCLVSCEVRDTQCGPLGEGEPLVQREHIGRLAHDILGVRARVPSRDEHPLADLERVDPGSDGLHDPGSVTARSVGRIRKPARQKKMGKTITALD